MINSHNQSSFFENQPLVLKMPDADVTYIPGFYSEAAAQALYQQLLDEVEWRQETVNVYGKNHLTPRLSCWMGDSGLSYRYSNMTMVPVPWNQTILSIKDRLMLEIGESFNSVLINNYRDGQDSNGWHCDDEPELGEQPIIASISLGAERDFQFRYKQDKRNKRQIALQAGSLLMMRGATQQYWQHQVPKRALAGGRINLTFRTIVSGAAD